MSGKWQRGAESRGGSVGARFHAIAECTGGRILSARKSSGEIVPERPRSWAKDDPVAATKNWYTTDLWTDFAIRFIDEARAEKKAVLSLSRTQRAAFPVASAGGIHREVSRRHLSKALGQTARGASRTAKGDGDR
jgi:arylsulfatase